jgi:SIR2-like domain
MNIIIGRSKLANTVDTLTEDQWDDLVDQLKRKICTPFLGAGASAGTLPLAKDIAEEWAKEYHYPLSDNWDLARVGQFIYVMRNPNKPRYMLAERFRAVPSPDFTQRDEIHALLAEAALPTYVTTNYDHFMTNAIKRCNRPYVQDFCRWNPITEHPEYTDRFPMIGDSFKGTPEKPLIYHLHGHIDCAESIVVSESDYLEFMVRLEDKSKELLPPAITSALSGRSVLFLGYSLMDWNFRIIFKSLMKRYVGSNKMPSIVVQLFPKDIPNPDRASEYLDRYFSVIQDTEVRIFWGNVKEFTNRLRKRGIGNIV